MSKKMSGKMPVIEQVAEMAMKFSHRHLAEYGATRSRHDFTQRQLMSCLIFAGLSQDHLPRGARCAGSQVVAIARKLVKSIGQSAAQQMTGEKSAAMDGTGLARTYGERLLLQPQRPANPPLGESISDGVLRQFAAPGHGGGLEANQ